MRRAFLPAATNTSGLPTAGFAASSRSRSCTAPIWSEATSSRNCTIWTAATIGNSPCSARARARPESRNISIIAKCTATSPSIPESNATKVNVAGGESDQIGFARAELEEVDRPKLSDTLQLPTDESPEELKRRFSEIYERQLWGPGSGVGSAPDKTVEYRAFVQQFMARNRVRSVVDLGCGEWQFSRLIDWSGVRYLGVDVVPAMIEKNQRDFGGDNIAFETFESLAKLPRADLAPVQGRAPASPEQAGKGLFGGVSEEVQVCIDHQRRRAGRDPEHRH